jgi:chromosome segregation ATPase
MDENTITIDDQTAEILSRDLISLEKQMIALHARNQKLQEAFDQLKDDDLQLDQSIEFLNGSVQDHEHKKAASVDDIEKLRHTHDQLVDEINKIQAMKKATASDKSNTDYLIESLSEELDSFQSEKTMALDKIRKMKKAIENINIEKERQLPKLKKYDAMLKRAHSLFVETKSRMDISLKLKKVLQNDEGAGVI